MNFDFLPWYIQTAALFLYYSLRAFTLVAVFFVVYRSLWGQRQKISARPYEMRQLKTEAGQTLQIFVLDALLLILFLRMGWFEMVSGNWLADIASGVVIFIWVEIWFYSFHRLLHHNIFWRFHVTHHKSRVPSPLSAFSFSLVERVILFLGGTTILVLASQAGYSMTIVGVQTYFGLNVFLSVLGHSDLRVYPQSWSRIPILNYWSVPAEHSLHHAKTRCNYGLFTNFLDRKLGTYQRPPL